jgi:hypothetical protein
MNRNLQCDGVCGLELLLLSLLGLCGPPTALNGL